MCSAGQRAERWWLGLRVVVFGASGRTGRQLVEQALEGGHEVTAFVRDSSKLGIEGEGLSVVVGDVMDAARVEEAVAGQDAVLSALGHTKTSAKDVRAVGTKNIVAAMKKHGVRRLVSLTGAGVRDPRDQPKLIDKAIRFLLKTLQRDVLEDAERHAGIIRESGLEWVIVRGPMLTDGPKTGEYRVGYVGKGSGTKASRADVAGFMLEQLTDDTHLGHAPMISY
jgi:putative NADH-flavin reductase